MRILRDRLRLQDAVETTPRGDEYVVSDTTAPNSPCHVPNPDVVSECGLSEVPSLIHPDDETEHDAFFEKLLLSMRGEGPLKEELDPRSRLRQYVDSKRILVAKKLCYAKPPRRS